MDKWQMATCIFCNNIQWEIEINVQVGTNLLDL